jgi:hypothetical protein
MPTRFAPALLVVLGNAALTVGQPAQPNDDAVAKLIAQLGAADFRTREQASNKLTKLGDAVLPALRKAAATNITLETKRRIENIVARIEDDLLEAEEKNWQDLDAPRRDIKDRLIRIVNRRPALDNAQIAEALYLLTSNRRPTYTENAEAQRRFKERNLRLVPVLQLGRALVQGHEFNADLAAANSRVLKAHEDFAATDLQLNGPETQTVIGAVAASLNRAAKTDEHFCDLAFLLMISRFPDKNQSTSVVAHLKNMKDRKSATENIIWALINTKEFMLATQ